MRYVLDASAAGALILPEEHSDSANRFIASLAAEDEIFVPSLWWFETGNILLQAYRRKRISTEQIDLARALLNRLPIQGDFSSGEEYQGRLITIATANSITVYDAAYFELSVRLPAKLISCDSELLQVCQKRKVPTVSLTTKKKK